MVLYIISFFNKKGPNSFLNPSGQETNTPKVEVTSLTYPYSLGLR